MEKIRIYTDESVNVVISRSLKRKGVDVLSARDSGNLGLTDEEQLIYASEEKATIFTHDTDFLRITARWMDEGRTHHGAYTAIRRVTQSMNVFEN